MQLADQIRRMPADFRNALLYLAAGWSSLLLTVHFLFKDRVLTVKLLVSAVIICFSVFQRRKWAKWLALFCNAIVILYGSFYAYLFLHGNMEVYAFVLAINILILGIASYYLLLKSTGQYFIAPEKPDDHMAPLGHEKADKENSKRK